MHVNSINKLSERESRLVKAGGRFSSLHSVIYELLLNSLDANANRIDVGIDKSTLEIVIRDNGNIPNIFINRFLECCFPSILN